FVHAMVNIVSGKYDGALKAEHGTGRNMAAFVETEWGTDAYVIMRDLKLLFDPNQLLNPGVIINADPQSHVTHLKTMSLVSPEVDQCIECGFCESKCPSRRLTLTPRQRIVVQREIARMRPADLDPHSLDSVIDDFSYAGIDTCAVDGLCATACPVNINTGDLTRRLRAESITPRGERMANWLAEHFSVTESTVGIAIRLGHFVASMIGARRFTSIIQSAEKITGTTLPKWSAHIPFPSKKLRALGSLRSEKDLIYFPSCIARQLGQPRSDSQVQRDCHLTLTETLFMIAQRANINLRIPNNITGTCCGMPFNSKGYTEAYQLSLHKAILNFWEWSEGGKFPIITDTTSCAHTLRTCSNGLTKEDLGLYQQLTILDSVEFIHDTLLPDLKLHPIDEDVILHPNCSAQKLGVQDQLVNIAKRCARSVNVPLNLGCCGFAGDRGFLFPELTASATQKESAEVNAREYGGYYSSNLPCEIGMSEATGKEYTSIVYLVERASRK
ncbi:MAG TPA: FAD-linked oxidase C-terminal domain-containing protein, partial [Anaerolineales bacterium]|nr:FAD-linked oxidase C-terminal domain-containing protein [Anaerolineales bacterium]